MTKTQFLLDEKIKILLDDTQQMKRYYESTPGDYF